MNIEEKAQEARDAIQNVRRMRAIHLMAARDTHGDDDDVAPVASRLDAAEAELRKAMDDVKTCRLVCEKRKGELEAVLEPHIPERYRTSKDGDND